MKFCSRLAFFALPQIIVDTSIEASADVDAFILSKTEKSRHVGEMQCSYVQEVCSNSASDMGYVYVLGICRDVHD